MGSLSWPVTLGSIADTVRTVYSGDDDDHEDETPPAPLTATAGGLKTACELAVPCPGGWSSLTVVSTARICELYQTTASQSGRQHTDYLKSSRGDSDDGRYICEFTPASDALGRESVALVIKFLSLETPGTLELDFVGICLQRSHQPEEAVAQGSGAAASGATPAAGRGGPAELAALLQAAKGGPVGGPGGLGMLLGMLSVASAAKGGPAAVTAGPRAQPELQPQSGAGAAALLATAASGAGAGPGAGGPPPELLKLLRDVSREKDAAARAAAAAAAGAAASAAAGASGSLQDGADAVGAAVSRRIVSLEAALERLTAQLASVLAQQAREGPLPAAAAAAALAVIEESGDAAAAGRASDEAAPAESRADDSAAAPSGLEGRVAALEATCALLDTTIRVEVSGLRERLARLEDALQRSGGADEEGKNP